MDRRKLAIGFIIYGSSTTKYLADFLSSLIISADSCGLDTVIIAWNNGPKDYSDNINFVRANDRIVLLGNGENIGFAKANNNLIAAAREAEANYFLAINPDTLLEPDSIKELLRPMETNVSIAATSPKVRRWDFAHKQKTNFIDTCGIVISAGLQFKDLGQGEEDAGQYDDAQILGPSGCVALYRMSALAKIKDEHGYFDDRFFMYKEDCDLALRMKLNKLQSVFTHQSIVYHDRTASASGDSLLARFKNQRQKSNLVRQWSYYSQWLIYFKHWYALNLLNKFAVILYGLAGVFYAILFDRILLTEISNAKKAANQ